MWLLENIKLQMWLIFCFQRCCRQLSAKRKCQDLYLRFLTPFQALLLSHSCLFRDDPPTV